MDDAVILQDGVVRLDLLPLRRKQNPPVDGEFHVAGTHVQVTAGCLVPDCIFPLLGNPMVEQLRREWQKVWSNTSSASAVPVPFVLAFVYRKWKLRPPNAELTAFVKALIQYSSETIDATLVATPQTLSRELCQMTVVADTQNDDAQLCRRASMALATT